MPTVPADTALAATRAWIERAVVGLNLCPFAKSVVAKGQVHLAACADAEFAPVLDALEQEADALLALAPAERDTSLLVLPEGFDDFLLFHQLVGQGERRLRKRGFDGVLQLASFHPAFCFADAMPDDPANLSNRSPYPTLHLLREASIDRAVQAFPDAAAIFGANIDKLRALGVEGWSALGLEAGLR